MSQLLQDWETALCGQTLLLSILRHKNGNLLVLISQGSLQGRPPDQTPRASVPGPPQSSWHTACTWHMVRALLRGWVGSEPITGTPGATTLHLNSSDTAACFKEVA